MGASLWIPVRSFQAACCSKPTMKTKMKKTMTTGRRQSDRPRWRSLQSTHHALLATHTTYIIDNHINYNCDDGRNMILRCRSKHIVHINAVCKTIFGCRPDLMQPPPAPSPATCSPSGAGPLSDRRGRDLPPPAAPADS